MKKLKNRIKRALAAFLKEELLEFIGYDDRKRMFAMDQTFRVDQIEFETMMCEARIGLHDGMDPRIDYEVHLDKVKRDFIDQIFDHVHVETFNLTNPQFAYQRVIQLKLRVQKKQ